MAELEDLKLEFDLGTFENPEFSFKTAFHLGEVSTQAYEKDQQALINRFTQLLGESATISPFSNNDTEGMTIESDHFLIISYRGTESRADWKYNFKTKQIFSWFLYPGRVHQGFVDALNNVWADVIAPAIAEAHSKGKKIYLTGHSLGGALCLLTAARIAKSIGSSSILGIYTYGQPRVGNQRFVDYISSQFPDNYYRFVNHRDIVPLIPPSQLKYRHCGKLYHFDEEGDLHEALQYESIGDGPQLEMEEFEQFKRKMLVSPKAKIAQNAPQYEAMPSPSQMFGIEDHSMINKYLPILRNQMLEETTTEP